MDFVKDLKEKIKDCQYGDVEESMLCDMIINGVKDDHCAMRLYDLDDDEVNLANVLRICRQSELTRTHLKKHQKEQQQAAPVHSVSRGRGTDCCSSHFHHGSSMGRPPRTSQMLSKLWCVRTVLREVVSPTPTWRVSDVR